MFLSTYNMHLKVLNFFREMNNSSVVPGKFLFCPDRGGTKNVRNLAEQDAASLLNVNCFVYFVNLDPGGWLLVLLQSPLKTGSVLDVNDAMLTLLSLGQVQCLRISLYTLGHVSTRVQSPVLSGKIESETLIWQVFLKKFHFGFYLVHYK